MFERHEVSQGRERELVTGSSFITLVGYSQPICKDVDVQENMKYNTLKLDFSSRNFHPLSLKARSM